MKIKSFILLIVLFAAAVASVNAQTRLRRPCPASTTPATVDLQRDGDISISPCSGRTVEIAGGTIPASVIGGTGTTNFVPRFTAASTLGNTPFSWNGTIYDLNNTGGNATFKFSLTPSASTSGSATLGNGSTGVILNETLGQAQVVGGAAASLNFQGVAGFGQATISATQFLRLTTPTIQLSRTVTAGGTTGNQTINQANGSVNFAAGSAALTVTNSTVTATSLIIATAQTNDSTCSVKNAVAGAGSFVINMTANCTAETRVAFWVTN